MYNHYYISKKYCIRVLIMLKGKQRTQCFQEGGREPMHLYKKYLGGRLLGMRKKLGQEGTLDRPTSLTFWIKWWAL